ncbi:CoA-transferase [Acuticoccus sp. MNP-M23]|uniref:acyl CoA:acetate/3-ketoacid CoA transferase n=1 Tax=Acuticoccus sp. MNP-M23 TaxID=3072793 RepID=UPI002815D743|nr:CoA-transferase [Acuticoccus sp. MNP-M23]WMS41372.1 CoA-transferase [Acuticoccus sp. MNP-M23]
MQIDVMTPEAIAAEIADGATIAVTGSGGGMLEADTIYAAMEARFLATGHPRDLTLIHALGIGDRKTLGTNRFAHDGMVRRVIGGHWTWSKPMQALAKTNRIEAYSLPSGVISLLLRESGAGRPGLITRTGLGTFVDPLHGGGRVNAAAVDDIVERVELGGETYLRYLPLKVDVAIIKGTFADTSGNISMMDEPADLDSFAVALAGHNCGGRVYVQVRDRVQTGSLRPREVSLPGILVDAITLCPAQDQTYRGGYDPALAGRVRTTLVPEQTDAAGGPKRVIALRAAMELSPGACVNFGFGASAGVAEIISERDAFDQYWTTIEQGIHGGSMLTGDMFGMAVNPVAILPASNQFDFYHGGGLDAAFLGIAEVDATGNVNVSHIGGEIVGPGGFIDITQNAKKVVFCGTFDARGSKVDVANGSIRIERDGEIRKFVPSVAAITFSGAEALARGQEVFYVTERAVFRLGPDGVELMEIAPGADLDRDILARMEFAPVVRNVKPMSEALFRA